MHLSSIEAMTECYDRYIAGSPLETEDGIRVLDLGGRAEPFGYHPIFQRLKGRDPCYLAADVAPKAGVTLVLDDPTTIPLADGSVPIVISGQTLEHCELFWVVFAEMVRVLRPDGYLFLICPSSGPIHRYPVDCYRFNPDAYRALAKYARCQLLDAWRSEVEPWRDLVGVFRKEVRPADPAILAFRTEAATAHRAGNLAGALERYRLAERQLGDDGAFLIEFLRAAVAAADHRLIYRLATKLSEAFQENAFVLLNLARSAMQLGRPAEAHLPLELVRNRSKPYRLAALACEISLGEQTGDDTLVRRATADAADMFLGGTAIDAANRWVVHRVRQSLRRLGESERLFRLTALAEPRSGPRGPDAPRPKASPVAP